MVELRGADEKGQTPAGGYERGRCGEDRREALNGAQGDQVEPDPGEVFGARALYIDVRQCKDPGDFAEEGGFLVIGFDQGERDLRSPELEGETGESRAGADVGDGKNVVRSLRSADGGNLGRVKGFNRRGR